MRLLLIQPPKVGTLGVQEMCSLEPLALERIAGALPEHDVRIADLRYDGPLERILDEHRPEACGVACCFTSEHDSVLQIARTVKEFQRDVFVAVAGHHASLSPERFADNAADAIVCGEGEETTAELLQCLAVNGDPTDVAGLCVNALGGQTHGRPREPIAHLDRLPLPHRDLTPHNRRRYFWGFRWPMALVETARGCPQRCKFCSVWRFYGGRTRLMTPERAVDEVAAVPGEHVFFTDDNFLISVPRARRIAELLRERGIRKTHAFQSRPDTIAEHPALVELWKAVGLHSVFLGLETTTAEALGALDKQGSIETNEAALDVLSRRRIGYTANFIVDPDCGMRQFADLREYVRRHGLFSASFSIQTPLPGTVLYDELRRLTTDACELFDLFHAVAPTRLPLAEFYRQYASLWAAAFGCRPRGWSWKRLLRMVQRVLTRRLPISLLRHSAKAARDMTEPLDYLVAHRQVAALHRETAGAL